MTVATMPTFGITDCQFTIQRNDFLSPENNGRLRGVTAGFPVWQLMVALQNMALPQGDAWQAFVDGLDGVQRPFLAYDVARAMPRFHSAGIPFTARPAGWSKVLDSDGNMVVTLEECMRGMVLSPRDYIGFEWGDTGRALARVSRGGVADVDGNLSAIVKPALPAFVPADAQANLLRPTAMFRLDTGNTKLTEPTYEGFYPAGGQISAYQDVAP
ncbi:hypothetical protein [Sphingomonas immobilis]|uniref:Uncharacterized protein n=1 Tax=Sphingomonas immobilis TaxID=3063997 RepID=A0ABT8ZU29_9SPHN|nr:hypothetical protein [Sphingomonas sp. CA1-15]MDO7841074.1 hypothetical protein [Sphingomonas sp. CA1-15]